MKAKRFSPNVVGSIEEAIEMAAEWRRGALRDHEEAKAALPELRRGRIAMKKKQMPKKFAVARS